MLSVTLQDSSVTISELVLVTCTCVWCRLFDVFFDFTVRLVSIESGIWFLLIMDVFVHFSMVRCVIDVLEITHADFVAYVFDVSTVYQRQGGLGTSSFSTGSYSIFPRGIDIIAVLDARSCTLYTDLAYGVTLVRG